jgi:hypothetical protein
MDEDEQLVRRRPALLLLAVAVLKPWRLAVRLAQALVAPGCPSASSGRDQPQHQGECDCVRARRSPSGCGPSRRPR